MVPSREEDEESFDNLPRASGTVQALITQPLMFLVTSWLLQTQAVLAKDSHAEVLTMLVAHLSCEGKDLVSVLLLLGGNYASRQARGFILHHRLERR